MKEFIKKAFSLAGLGVYRLNGGQSNQPPKPVVSSPIHHNSKEGLEEFYSDKDVVESYLDPKFYERLIDLLKSHGVDYNGKRIADIGCGTGGLLKSILLRAQPTSLTGFEYSEKALAIARSQVPGVDFRYLDIYEPAPFQFEVLFCIEVLEHLLYPDKALRNILRMMASRGALLLTVPNGRTDSFDGHINFWSPESWKVFVEQSCDGCAVEFGLIEDGTTNFAVISR